MFKKAVLFAAVAATIVVVVKRLQQAKETRDMWQEAVVEPEEQPQLP